MSAAREFETVEYEESDGVATIWFSRPEVRNAITHKLIEEHRLALSLAAQDDSVKALLLRGRGAGFCSGADLRELRELMDRGPQGLFGLSKRVSEWCSEIESHPKPVVAVIHGHAVAGGFEVMLACDFAIAAADARIGDFHLNRELIGGGGPSYRLPRLVGLRRAKEIVLLGKLLSGDEAAKCGLVNLAAPGQHLDEVVRDFVSPLLSRSALAVEMAKLALNQGLEAPRAAMAALEHASLAAVSQTAETRAAVEAFLDRRASPSTRAVRR